MYLRKPCSKLRKCKCKGSEVRAGLAFLSNSKTLIVWLEGSKGGEKEKMMGSENLRALQITLSFTLSKLGTTEDSQQRSNMISQAFKESLW